MFEPLIWQDEVRSPDNTFSVTHNADGTVTTKRAGEQIQKGTNQSATNFNFMSNQGFEAGLIASLLTQEVVQHKRKIEDLDGQTIEVTLSNSLSYPFNNSKKTVSIDTKDTLDYRVAVELIEDVPNVGEIIITDKQINGFKIAYTGSAKSVKVRCFVTGGIPAHFASNKGLGKSAENAIKKYQEFLLFSAVEVRNEEDVREYNNKLKNKAINKAVLITGSDNPSNRDEAQHSIEGFGKMFTWIKLSTLSFEGLRQVFIDPEHRCINWLSLQKIGVQFDPTFNWISVIRLPDFITEKDFAWAVQTATKKKKIDCSPAEFLTIDEGLCVQIMHQGSFDSEPATVALLENYLKEQGYENNINEQRLHHEIYMSDARKVAPEKWKTVIRHPIKKV